MGINNYIIPICTVLALIIVEVFCGDISNIQLSTSRANRPWSDTSNHDLQILKIQNNTTLLNSEWPALNQKPTDTYSNFRTNSQSSPIRPSLQAAKIPINALSEPSTLTNNRFVIPQSRLVQDDKHITSHQSQLRPVPPTNDRSNASQSELRPTAPVNAPQSQSQPTLPTVTTQSQKRPIPPTSEPHPQRGYRPVTSQQQSRPNSSISSNPQSILRPISPLGNAGQEFNQQDAMGDEQGGTYKPETEDDELRNFSEMLLTKEVNSALNTISVNYQGKTTSRSLTDEAPLPLIEVSSEIFQIPTIARLKPLYDNYIPETLENEHVTPLEREEENSFLDVVLATKVMRFTRNFLIQKGKIGKDPREFRDFLKTIWFSMYSRGKGRIGSSGFEHIFLSEIKNNEVSGLHNWLYFYEEEARKRANYLGYMKKLEFSNKGTILKFHFNYHGIDKPVGSMFIGTSPEFEMALYTTCYALRADRICPLQLDGKRFIIRTFNFRYRGKNMIGSAFPEI